MTGLLCRLSGRLLIHSGQGSHVPVHLPIVNYYPYFNLVLMRASHSLKTLENKELGIKKPMIIKTDKKLRSRLRKVAKILQQRTQGNEFKAQMIFQLYKVEGADLIRDLMSSDKFVKGFSQTLSEADMKSASTINKLMTVKDYIWNIIPKSLNAQAMTLDLLITNALTYNLKLTCEALLQLFTLSRIPACDHPKVEVQAIHEQLQSVTVLDGSMLEDLRSKICDICIQFSIGLGRPFITALLLNRCMDHSVYITPSTIKNVLISLSVSHSLLGNYQNYTLIKLINKLEGKDILSATLYLRLISNMCKSDSNPFFPNIILHKAIDLNEILHDLSHTNLSALKDLISLNIDKGHVQKALQIWKLGYDYDPEFPYNNIGLLRKLFMSCDMSDKAELVSNNFPEDLLTHKDLFDVTLAFFGLHPDFNNDFIELSKFVTPPISRPLLSSLLISFLSRNSKREVSLLTKAIINSQGGLMPDDVDALVKHCLKKSDFSEALRIVFHNKISATKLGYVRLTKFILKNALDGFVVKIDRDDSLYETVKSHVSKANPDISSAPLEDSPQTESINENSRLQSDLILNLVTIELMKLGDDPVLKDLTLVLLDYLCKKNGCAVGRRFFMRSKKHNSQSGFRFDFVKFGLPRNFIHLVKIDDTNQLRCLKIILDHAKTENDQTTIEWCISELRRAGMLVEDIIKENFCDLVRSGNL